jgi:hypothetical protein
VAVNSAKEGDNIQRLASRRSYGQLHSRYGFPALTRSFFAKERVAVPFSVDYMR